METGAAGEPSAVVPSRVLLPYVTTNQQWDNHRATITHLYREENKTLGDVMSTMERNYHFKAT